MQMNESRFEDISSKERPSKVISDYELLMSGDRLEALKALNKVVPSMKEVEQLKLFSTIVMVSILGEQNKMFFSRCCAHHP